MFNLCLLWCLGWLCNLVVLLGLFMFPVRAFVFVCACAVVCDVVVYSSVVRFLFSYVCYCVFAACV